MIEEINNSALIKLDELEEQITNAQKIIKEYDELKSEIKKAMKEVCEKTNAEQVKWTTNKGTKITFTKGHIATIEKEIAKELDVDKLKAFYKDVYDICLVDKERSVITKNATSDTIRITLGGNNDK